MSFKRRAQRMGRKLILGAGAGLVALGLVLAAFGFFAAAFFLWTEHLWGAPAAAAATGASLLLLAALAGWSLFTILQPRPGQNQTLALELDLALSLTRLLGGIIRRDPKWAMLAALLTGALAEHFGDGKSRD